MEPLQQPPTSLPALSSLSLQHQSKMVAKMAFSLFQFCKVSLRCDDSLIVLLFPLILKYSDLNGGCAEEKISPLHHRTN